MYEVFEHYLTTLYKSGKLFINAFARLFTFDSFLVWIKRLYKLINMKNPGFILKNAKELINFGLITEANFFILAWKKLILPDLIFVYNIFDIIA